MALGRNPQRTFLGDIELDAVLSESHGAENDVPEHPVEEGSNTSDHIRPKSDTIRLEGFISNSPLHVLSPAADRAESAYRRLLQLRTSRQLISIVTPLRRYDNMAMLSLDVPKDIQPGDAIRFTATFRQIRIVRNQLVQLQRRKEIHTLLKEDKGKQASKPAEAATVNKSALKGIADSEPGDATLKFFKLR